MTHCIAIGCDLHDRSITAAIGCGRDILGVRRWANDGDGRQKMVSEIHKLAAEREATRIVLVYEASGQGFQFLDWLEANEIETYVLAPTKLARSTHQDKTKTDARDAEALLHDLNSYLLAGRPLPAVWVPSRQLREDRELVRARHEVGAQIGQTKTQIRSLLRKYWIDLPRWFTENRNWTRRLMAWMNQLIEGSDARLPTAARSCLKVFVSRLLELQREQEWLEKELHNLANEPRYQRAYEALTSMCGVGLVTAMTFLTEMGDLSRFQNRQQVGAFLGLVPTSHESGERHDRKGHITRQGPARLRRVLCQAAWAAIHYDPSTTLDYERLKRNTKARTRLAAVAVMRRLAIRMWHRARDAVVRAGEDFAWASQKAEASTGPGQARETLARA
jgi:transposase